MSLVSEKTITEPTAEQLAAVRAYIRVRLELEQQGMTSPKMGANVYLHLGISEKAQLCTLTEFTELAHQMATVYRAIFGKDLKDDVRP